MFAKVRASRIRPRARREEIVLVDRISFRLKPCEQFIGRARAILFRPAGLEAGLRRAVPKESVDRPRSESGDRPRPQGCREVAFSLTGPRTSTLANERRRGGAKAPPSHRPDPFREIAHARIREITHRRVGISPTLDSGFRPRCESG